MSVNDLAKPAVKAIIAAANKPLATRRLHRAMQAANPPYKVQIGAGTIKHPGWILTDIAWNAPAYLDATKPWPFPAGSVSHVYADNVIEHVRMAGARAILCHAMTALRSGGRIRLATPDIERIARIYLERDSLAEACMAENQQTGYEVHHHVDLLTNTFTEAGHHLGYLWDFPSLSAELERAGFVKIERRDGGESDDPALRGLEARSLDIHDARALIIEARKG